MTPEDLDSLVKPLNNLVAAHNVANQQKEMMMLLDIAERCGITVHGSLTRNESAGMGLAPYTEILDKGTQYVEETVFVLLGKQLSSIRARRLFQLGFEMASAKMGDVYNPIQIQLDLDGSGIPGPETD